MRTLLDVLLTVIIGFMIVCLIAYALFALPILLGTLVGLYVLFVLGCTVLHWSRETIGWLRRFF